MGKYNFDEVIDRHGTDCLKYDFGMKRKGRDDLLPLWVADMDFRLPDEILDEFHKRIDHGIFGYTDPLDEYFDAMNHWFSTRYGYTIKPEWVTLGAGIVYALGSWSACRCSSASFWQSWWAVCCRLPPKSWVPTPPLWLLPSSPPSWTLAA